MHDGVDASGLVIGKMVVRAFAVGGSSAGANVILLLGS